MTGIHFNIIKADEGSVITCYVPGNKPLVADDTHPNFDRIVEGALADDPSVIKLFDVAATAAEYFEPLSDRVSVKGGVVYLDGDPVDDVLTKQIVRFLDEGEEDFMPLVNFFENVQANPNEHSREQLFKWLDNRDFSINEDGMIVGYKGVEDQGDGIFVSVHAGKAMVDGKVITGRIPNPIGGIIEMPRSEVHHDPTNGCSSGLHVADFDFASGWGNTVLEVEVNPRDVVSVPTEDNTFAKVRCCRYKVIGISDRPHDSALRRFDPVVPWYEEGDSEELTWGDGEDDFCEDCGEYLDDCDCLSDEEAERLSSNVNNLLGVYPGDVFRDLDSREKRKGRELTVEMVDRANNVAKCRSSTSGKLVDISIDRLLTAYRFERVN